MTGDVQIPAASVQCRRRKRGAPLQQHIGLRLLGASQAMIERTVHV
jgi:hypothetical protein